MNPERFKISGRRHTMRNRSSHSVAAFIVKFLILCLGVLLLGEPFSAGLRQQAQVAPSTADTFHEASVKVRLPAGKTAYQVGEEIPLELEFRGRASQDFYLSTESYDRSGRRVDQGGELEGSFLTTLARLRTLKELPAVPGNSIDRRNRMTALQAEYETRWRAGLSRSPINAAALRAELDRMSNGTPEFQQETADRLVQNPAAAAEAFATLRTDTQSALLQSSNVWKYLNRPWIVPALRRIYLESTGGSSPFDMGNLVLTRLYELDRVEGRQLILEEIRTGQHRNGYDALAILPEKELPELDSALQARFSGRGRIEEAPGLSDNGTTAWLIARYGSSALVPFVTNVISQRAFACAPEGGLLGYLFKHEPAAAMKRFAPGLDRPASCVSPLVAVSRHYWDDRVEALAIAQLEESGIQNVVEAAQLLGERGSSTAKKPLLDRLAQWSAQWRDRADQLGKGRMELSSPERIENFVINALFQNPQFALTVDEIANIRSLCLTDQCRRMAEARAR